LPLFVLSLIAVASARMQVMKSCDPSNVIDTAGRPSCT
jgi:hypothetical protein